MIDKSKMRYKNVNITVQKRQKKGRLRHTIDVQCVMCNV